MMPMQRNTIYTPSLESSEKFGSACIRSMSLCSISTILAKIQVLMLQSDIERMQADPNFSLDSSDGVYIVFLCIGIIGYFTIPTVAGWIIQAGGMGSYNRTMNQMAGRAGGMAGGVAGATAGNAVGRIGKLLK